MRTSQATLKDNKPEFCEYSEPLDNYYRCKLTDFGFVFRCIKEDRSRCPDLEFFRKQRKERKQ